MNKNYLILAEGASAILEYDTFEEAEKKAQQLAKIVKRDIQIYSNTVTVVGQKDTNERIRTYEDACEYLGYNNYDGEHTYILVPSKYAKKTHSIYRLTLIAEAWNKLDDLIDRTTQNRYYPFFSRDNETKKLVCVDSYNVTPDAYLTSDLLFLFKTSERAKQFGKQFIDLWNDLL